MLVYMQHIHTGVPLIQGRALHCCATMFAYADRNKNQLPRQGKHSQMHVQTTQINSCDTDSTTVMQTERSSTLQVQGASHNINAGNSKQTARNL